MTKWLLACAVLFSACGDGDGDGGSKPNRYLRPGVLMSGPAGGSERISFSDGSSVSFTVSGRMAMLLPKGVYLGSTFPATVTFAVVSSGGNTRTGKASFEHLTVDSNKRFTGQTETGHGAATIDGSFVTVTDSTYAKVQSFSYDITGGSAPHTVYLQSDRLDQEKLAPQP